MIRRKVIYGCESRGDGKVPYLTRWTLLETRWGSLYLHLFHRSDADVLHDHPFAFWSLVLWRGYVEVTPRRRTRRWPLSLVRRPAEWVHRVELLGGRPALTLFWRGERVREWGFHTPAGWVPWQEYFRRMGC